MLGVMDTNALAVQILIGPVMWAIGGQLLVMLSDAGISWRSRKQISVALSSAEAEYVALSGAVQETIWLNHFIVE